MEDSHSKYHSANAFCGNAGHEEMQHLRDLISELSDSELKQLVGNVGIIFTVDDYQLDRDAYEMVVDEADREDFYREYKRIIKSRKK